jgi:hypothetical protein
MSAFPVHPLPDMQAAFDESLLDATADTPYVPFTPPARGVKTRQHLLCRQPDAPEQAWNCSYSCHWRHHPSGRHHPLRKTLAQIVFGLHLLHNHLEKSTADVADILLKHVHELDSFLQRANDDLDQSLKDMLFRHKCLRVPMEHVNDFDRLLDDRSYRVQLLDGNITIERTINRMSLLLSDYRADFDAYRDANHALGAYLHTLGDAWPCNQDVAKIYSAMCGNTAGWAQFLQSLSTKAERLGLILVQVSSYCKEIEKRCGAASRRSMIATHSSSRNSSRSNLRDTSRASRRSSTNKPLPTPPIILNPPSDYMSRTPADADPRGRSTSQTPTLQALPERAKSPLAELPAWNEDSPTSAGAQEPQEYVPDWKPTTQPHSQPDTYHNSEPRVKTPTSPQSDENRTIRVVHHHQPSHSSRTDSDGPPSSKKEDYSPPLTAKDSAYSSVSGASVASPTMPPPRTASSVSSHPPAQFALFPSSSKGSISGRSGVATPLSSNLRAVKSAEPPNRPDTSISNYDDMPIKRLSKRGSLSSIRRFFTRRRGDIHTIAE